MTDDLTELYQELILDHSRSPRNFRVMPNCHHVAQGNNPICGDNYTLYADLDGDVVRDISFQGSGCAISKASASILTESLKGKTVAVQLTDFSVFYSQDNADAAAAALKEKGSKIVVEKGQIVKVMKDAKGLVKRERLTRNWTDWIDYWAVDFDYESRPETLIETRTRPDGSVHHVPQWTDRFIFENEWQSFRTRTRLHISHR